jgi:hypothetical protein
MGKHFYLLVDMSTNKAFIKRLSPFFSLDPPRQKTTLFLWLTYSHFVNNIVRFL